MNDWIEIFRTGEHTDSKGRVREWSEDDLDKMVSTYNPDQHEAPVVIGEPKHDDPAFAWVDKLMRVGKQLLAKFKQVDPAFARMMEEKRFSTKRITLYPDGSLRHIGFMGAAAPGLPGLKRTAFSEYGFCFSCQESLVKFELPAEFAESNSEHNSFFGLTYRV